MAIFNGTNGADSFVGADGEADTFRFTPATLGASDTVIGGGGAFTDILQFTAAGGFEAPQFNGVAGIERIQHHAGGNAYALTAALVAGAVGSFEVRGAAGADSVDGSAIANPLLRISFFAGGGADTLVGGAGNDSFSVLAGFAGARHFAGGGGHDQLVTQAAFWSGSDVFLGGAGVDRLLFNASGSIAAGALAGLGSVEEIQFGNTLTIALALNDAAVAQAGGVLAVLGGVGGAQRVDGSAVTAGAIRYVAGTGADTFLGGAGDDRFEVSEALSTGTLGGGDDVLRLTSKLAQGILVEGGAGHDVVELFAGGVWDLAGLTGFEEVELLAASTLTLPGTPGFRVLGSSARDVITLGGPNQRVFGFAGDDVVAVTAASFVGAVVHGGTETTADTLRLDTPGTYNLRRSGVAGFERIEQLAAPGGISNILLPDTPFDVVLRHATSLSLGAHAQQSVAGSARNDVIALGAAGQFVDAGGGADTISGTAGTLQLGTVVAGGAGEDLLRILGGTVNLGNGALVLDVERISLVQPTDLVLDVTPDMELAGSFGADTVRALGTGLHGDLGPGNDLLMIGGIGLLPGSAETLSGGSGTDRLALFEDFTGLDLIVPTRFVGFEVIDLNGLFNRQVTLLGSESRLVELGAGPVQVFGSEGAEEFISDGAFNLVSGGGGADTIRQTVAPSSGQALVGNGGDDVIVFAPDTGTATIAMPTAWAAETVRLVGTHNFTANLQSGLRVVGDPTLSGIVFLRGDFQRADGGSSADQLSNIGGLATTLAGGEGPDFYVVDASLPALWSTPGQTILDTGTAFTLNTMRIVGTGTLAIDFAQHSVRFIDRIDVVSPTAAVRLTLTEQMARDADSNNGGASGDFDVVATAAMSVGARLDASAFLANSVFRMSGSFDAADTVSGGGGNDSIAAAGGADSVTALAGNDTVSGGAGADTLNGGAGSDLVFGDADADVLTAGDGADTVIGGAGGDRVALAEGNPLGDIVRFLDIGDGTVDLNDAAGVSQTTADSISGFDASLDKVHLSRSGLGLGSGGVQNVAANGAWNIGSNAVFLFESDSGNSDTLNENSFASLDAIAFAINTDNGAGSGSSAGRTVALVVSNLESAVPRATGIYVWTDTDGDSLLEASDVVRLLGVFHGVTANQMAAGAAVLIA